MLVPVRQLAALASLMLLGACATPPAHDAGCPPAKQGVMCPILLHPEAIKDQRSVLLGEILGDSRNISVGFSEQRVDFLAYWVSIGVRTRMNGTDEDSAPLALVEQPSRLEVLLATRDGTVVRSQHRTSLSGPSSASSRYDSVMFEFEHLERDALSEVIVFVNGKPTHFSLAGAH
ncbi:hypothetical protein HY251_19045 [bacterium]|nr:hypothetical protein [bacterium]